MPIDYSFRQGGLPGILSTTTPSGPPENRPFAILNELNGDAGLSEAIRIYWAIKSLTLTASANASFSLGPAVVAYSDSAEYPGSTATWDRYDVLGSIVGSPVNVSDPRQYVEPPFRPCTQVSASLPPVLEGFASKFISASFPEEGYSYVLEIELRFVSGRYRIYPFIRVDGSKQFTPATPYLLNGVGFFFGIPTLLPNYDSVTGTLNILGYNFDYVCEARCGDASGTATINSQSLTITSSSW